MLWQFLFLACTSLAHPQPQETTTYIPCPVCSYEGTIPKHEMLAFEAIYNLHKSLDDDANGNIDLEESEEFLREELEYVGNRQGKLEKFHGKKKMVSVDDFWNTWNTSQVHGWTVDDVAEWMDTHLMLPQYRESVIQHQINGTMLPRLAIVKDLTLLQLLGIDDPIHRHKINIKAMEVVLFGPPREYISGRNLKWIFTSVIVGFVTLSWFAYRQIRLSKMKLLKVMKDLDRLANAEKAFVRLQAEHEVLSNKHGYTDENGERRFLSENDSENLALKYEQLKIENELLYNRLKEIEQKTSWKTPTELAHWLQLTYEIETASFNRKREQADLQLAAARRACDQLKKKRSNVISAFISTHGNGLEDVDGSISQARNALMDVTRDLGERTVRWRTIERICGIAVISNPGLNYLRFVLKNDSRFFQSSDSGSEAAANFQEFDGPVMKTSIPETSLRSDPSFSTPVRELPARLDDFPVSPVVDKMLRKDSSDMILGMEADMLRPRSSSASTARVTNPVDFGLEEKKTTPTVPRAESAALPVSRMNGIPENESGSTNIQSLPVSLVSHRSSVSLVSNVDMKSRKSPRLKSLFSSFAKKKSKKKDDVPKNS